MIVGSKPKSSKLINRSTKMFIYIVIYINAKDLLLLIKIIWLQP